jgi:hypothetical protein
VYSYFYSSVSPTRLTIYADGSDANALGTTPVHGGETVTVDLALYTPTSYGGGVQTLGIYLDGTEVATTVSPGTYAAPTASFVLPPADGLTHTLRATFGGASGFAPTVSPTISFTLVP